jgi:hypothetical protein
VTLAANTAGVITARALTVTAAVNTKPYDGTTSASAVPTITSGSLAGTDTAAFSETYAGKNVGTGITLTPTGTASDGNSGNNYIYNYVGSTNGVITPAALTVTANNASRSYGAANPTFSAAYTGFVNGETSSVLTTQPTISTTAVSTSPVGTYPITPSGAAATNYSFTYVNGTLTITQTTPVITWANPAPITYGTALSMTQLNATASANGSSVPGNFVYNPPATTVLPVGNNQALGVTFTPTDTTDYSTATDSVQINVTQATTVVAPNAATGTYGGTVSLSANVTSGGFALPNVSVSFTLNGASVGSATTNSSGLATLSSASLAGIGAGTYATGVSASFAGNSSYGAGSGTASLTVSQATLTPTITASNKPYDGTTATTAGEVTGHLAGVLSGDTGNVSLTWTGAVFASANVGTGITVTASGLGLSGGAAGNYTLGSTTSAQTTASITAAALTITASSQSKTYGQVASLGTTAFTTSGLLGSDTVTGVTLTSTIGAPASASVAGSPYTITPSAATGTGLSNYAITYTGGALTVIPATLTVTATGVNKPYDGTTNATVTLTDNRISGDNLTESYTSASFASKNVGTGIAVSVSGISITGGSSAGNYTLGNATATTSANITAAGLTIAASAQSKTYGQVASLGTTAFTTSGLLGSDTVTGVTLTSTTGAPASASVAGSPYTITPSAATGTGLSNYAITYTGGALTVIPATLTVTATGVNKPYDGGTTATVTLTDNRLSGDTLTESYTSASFASKNVGTGIAVSVSGISITGGASAGNYTLANTTATTSANITAAGLTITASNQSKTYGQVASLGTTAFTTTGLLGSDTVTGVTLTSATGAPAAASVAGSPYTITPSAAAGTGLSNYAITYTGGALTVAPATLTVTATGVNKPYDGTANATVTLTDNRVSGDTLTESYASASFASQNVGTGIAVNVSGISITGGSSAGNYTLGNTTATTSANITSAGLTITASNQSKTYGQTMAFGSGSTAFTASGLLGSDTIGSVTLACGGGAATAGVAGSPYTITPSAAVFGTGSAGNYNITYANGALTVIPATLTVTATGVNKTYDGGTTATVTLTDNRVSGDTLTESYASASFASQNVGTGIAVNVSGISITGGSSAGNYTLANTTASTTANINAAGLTVTASAQSKTYGQVASLGTTAFTTTGLLGSDTVTGVTLASTTGAPASASVAGSPYTITPSAATGTGLSNYTITYASGALTVIPATLTVTATGVNKPYDGTTNATVTLTDNRVSGDSLTESYASASFASKNVGTGIAVSVSGISITGGASAANYTLANTTATTTANITSAGLTITASNQSKTYGQTVAFGSGSTAFTAGGLQGSDTIGSVTLACSGGAATAGVAGSPYTITPSAAVFGAGSAGNYNITYANGALTVIPATLTVTATGVNKTYDGGTTATVTLTDNRVSGDSLTESYISASFASQNVGTGIVVNVSGISITGGSSAGNYTLANTTASTTANINAAGLTVTASAQSKTYGQVASLGTTAFTTTGLLGSDTVTGVTLTSTTGAPASATVAGSPYTIMPSAAQGSGLTNYTITYTNGTLTVNSATLTITANSTSKAYGQTLTFAGTEFTTSGLVNGDTVSSVTLTSTGTPASAAVGNYNIVPSAAVGAGLGNYTIGYVNGTLTVTYNSVTVNGSAYNYPQGQSTYRATFSMNNVNGGPAVTPSGSVNYYYIGTRMNFVSTGISSVSISGTTVTVTGTGTVNGAGSYTFTATLLEPNTFGITIMNGASTYYTAAPQTSSGTFAVTIQ